MDFFPVLFVVPRVVGWLAHWRQVLTFLPFSHDVADGIADDAVSGRGQDLASETDLRRCIRATVCLN